MHWYPNISYKMLFIKIIHNLAIHVCQFCKKYGHTILISCRELNKNNSYKYQNQRNSTYDSLSLDIMIVRKIINGLRSDNEK